MSETKNWPVVPGSYIVGDPKSPVAICTLTSERLMGPLASSPGVAIAGMVYTANLGITRIILNITSNPAIRFLLLCGRDSQLFRPGQSLVALAERGVNDQKRIVGASGYDPTLPTLNHEQITRFRNQVEVVDWTGEENLDSLKARIGELSARNPGPFKADPSASSIATEQFVTIRPGGQREPLIYDPKGYFVISIEPEKEEIVLRHYIPNHTPAHEMRGRGATSMLLGLLRDGLVTQLSHAGYLGEELAKAQTALQFNLRYDQDRPLRSREPATTTVKAENAQSPQTTPSKPPPQPMSLNQLEDKGPGATVDFNFNITETPVEGVLEGLFLEMDEAEPFSAYHRTSKRVQVRWTPTTRIIMGEANEIRTGALVRIVGKLEQNQTVSAEQIVILTRVARILA